MKCLNNHPPGSLELWSDCCLKVDRNRLILSTSFLLKVKWLVSMDFDGLFYSIGQNGKSPPAENHCFSSFRCINSRARPATCRLWPQLPLSTGRSWRHPWGCRLWQPSSCWCHPPKRRSGRQPVGGRSQPGSCSTRNPCPSLSTSCSRCLDSGSGNWRKERKRDKWWIFSLAHHRRRRRQPNGEGNEEVGGAIWPTSWISSARWVGRRPGWPSWPGAGWVCTRRGHWRLNWSRGSSGHRFPPAGCRWGSPSHSGRSRHRCGSTALPGFSPPRRIRLWEVVDLKTDGHQRGRRSDKKSWKGGVRRGLSLISWANGLWNWSACGDMVGISLDSAGGKVAPGSFC